MIKKMKCAEILGWYGTVAIVMAYALVSFKFINSDGFVYQILNLTGAIGLLIISVIKRVRQTAILNIFWALIAALTLIGLLLSR